MGRHRKPSSSSISVAKIAVTGAVIGTGGLGMAGAAHAASDSEWDTVARCESSGNWAINTGNGYHGGLQFAPSTWLGYGGGQFASAAHLATKDQQIAIAEKVLAGQGKGAWPVCGRGLSGPTPRTLSSQTAPKPADTPQPVAALTEKEVAPAAPAPEAPAAPAPAPEAPAAPAPDAPTIVDVEHVTVADDVTPKAAVETVSVEGEVLEDQVVAVGGELADSAPAPAVVPADHAPAPSAPAPGPAPVAPAKSTPAATPAVVPASSTTTTAAADQAGVQHLPSPNNPPPGTSDEPVGPASNANVSYLKELWHAVQNQEIDRNDLMLALASRSLNSPVQSDADPAPAAAAAAAVAN
jgi:hypothetical protein